MKKKKNLLRESYTLIKKQNYFNRARKLTEAQIKWPTCKFDAQVI